MLRIRRLFFIYIFLCAAFSVNVHAQDVYYRAALCEREVFCAQSPMEYNSAILKKADILQQAGEYKAALSALDRVKNFCLAPSQRDSVALEKAYLAYRIEDYDRAFSYLQEVDRAPVYEKPHLKNEWASMFLTFLVPAGFLYVGDPAGAAVYTCANALSVGYIAFQISSGCYLGGILGGAMALNLSFMGAQEKVALLTQKRNLESIKKAKRQALSSFFQASSEGRTERPE